MSLNKLCGGLTVGGFIMAAGAVACAFFAGCVGDAPRAWDLLYFAIGAGGIGGLAMGIGCADD